MIKVIVERPHGHNGLREVALSLSGKVHNLARGQKTEEIAVSAIHLADLILMGYKVYQTKDVAGGVELLDTIGKELEGKAAERAASKVNDTEEEGQENDSNS